MRTSRAMAEVAEGDVKVVSVTHRTLQFMNNVGRSNREDFNPKQSLIAQISSPQVTQVKLSSLVGVDISEL